MRLNRQTTAFANGVLSELSGLETNPALVSIFSAIETNPALASSVEAWADSISPDQTSIDFDGLPTEVRGPLSSAIEQISGAAVSIATANGFTTLSDSAQAGGSATSGATSKATGASSGAGSGSASGSAAAQSTGSSSSQSGAEPTGRMIGAAVGVAAGLVGAVMAL